MPIRPENKARYPADWNLRRRFILRRAKNCCEWCGVRNYSVGYRDEKGNFVPVCGNLYLDCAGFGMNQYWTSPISYTEAKKIADHENEYSEKKYIVVVLTIAHVYDHRPEACSLLNLAALCQRCHLRHDIKHHAESRQARIQNESKQIELML